MLSNSSTVTDGIAKIGGTNAVAATNAAAVVARMVRRDAWREESLALFHEFDWNVKAPVLLERSIAANAVNLASFIILPLQRML
jgi:hypothetical protein